MDWKYQYLIKQIQRTAYECHEAFIIGSLIHDQELADLKPCTQYYVKKHGGGYALIDLFYPQLDYAIEIDEPHHVKNTGLDEIRQCNIESEISCKFQRIKISDGNVIAQISNLKKNLKQELELRRNNQSFKNWEQPNSIDISELKRIFKNSLFIKIKGEIHPDDLMARQTGYWRIDKNKWNKIKSVYIVHDGAISRVFTDISWFPWIENPSKVGYRGIEDDNHELVGTIVTNWKTQQTITYSNDIYQQEILS